MKRVGLTLAAAVAVVLVMAPKARANVNDFVIRNFYGIYELTDDVKGGRMAVSERIDLTFSADNRGIQRAIPKSYQGQPLMLRVLSVERNGQPEPYTTYTQNDNEVLRIGDPEKTIIGEHTYEIAYEMTNVIRFFENYDEWYWDINGDQWQQPFLKVSGEVILPSSWEETAQENQQAACFTGTYGESDTACELRKTETGYVFSTTKPLRPQQTVTIAAPIKKGVFTPRTTADWLRDNIWQFIGVATGLGLGAVAFQQWRRYGKDYKGAGIIVPQYKPPQQLSPAEVGLLMDYNLDNRDLSATIIDLAVRGYVRIHDEQTRRFGGLIKSRTFKLELVNEKTGKLKPHEKKLLQAIFRHMDKGIKQDLHKVSQTKVHAAVTAIRKELREALVDEHGLIEETPVRAQVMLWAIGVGSFIVLVLTRPDWGWMLGLLLAALSAFVSGVLMRRRTHAGTEVYDHIKGLKWYMDTAEKRRYSMMQSVDRPYAEPGKTADLFEELLPYAVALGVEKSWAKQFDGIYDRQPSWYSGNYASFSTVHLASAVTSSVSSMNTSFSQPTSSSTSGTGGGGFAGGGGGGGGGSGW